ncbi:MAG: fumarate hydratase C-terminal domain-containing protein [Planctomycetota bacterium]
MAEMRKLRPPLGEGDVRSLKAGDEVAVSGVVYTARDMAHKRLCEAIDAGEKPAKRTRQTDPPDGRRASGGQAAGKLPFELEGAIIYFVGPTPARPGRVIGAAGPTTSSRMDPFSPRLIANGLRAMIGKGYRGEQVREALKKYGAVHLAAVGGAGALLSKYIVSAEVVAYEDLGTEAVRRLEVVDFPAVVAYDAYGNTVYCS